VCGPSGALRLQTRHRLLQWLSGPPRLCLPAAHAVSCSLLEAPGVVGVWWRLQPSVQATAAKTPRESALQILRSRRVHCTSSLASSSFPTSPPPHLGTMAAPIVYHDVAPGADLHGQLFAGKKFWVAQRVVSRPRYLDLIRSNGGEIVPLEKKADYLIADHATHHCPPASISYTFIDESIAKGEIQDPAKHRAGPPEGTARAPGSLSRAPKATRAAYTSEEDRVLYKWVHDHQGTGLGPVCADRKNSTRDIRGSHGVIAM
jgi:hypothetical protein